MNQNNKSTGKVQRTTFFKKKYYKNRKFYRNKSRRQRRKYSIASYYKNLKNTRVERYIHSLCPNLAFLDIANMESEQVSVGFNNSITEVEHWHQKEQVAYWKSKAISLEYENKMLHEHLRNVYAQQVNYNQHYYNQNNSNYDQNNLNVESTNEEANVISDNKKAINNGQMDELSQPPTQHLPNRKEEMKNLYGSYSSKIMGMETANQLNHERLLRQLKPKMWPDLPLNLG